MDMDNKLAEVLSLAQLAEILQWYLCNIATHGDCSKAGAAL